MKNNLPEKVKIISNTPLKPIDTELIKSISKKTDESYDDMSLQLKKKTNPGNYFCKIYTFN